MAALYAEIAFSYCILHMMGIMILDSPAIPSEPTLTWSQDRSNKKNQFAFNKNFV
jgi:hypothetical protein